MKDEKGFKKNNLAYPKTGEYSVEVFKKGENEANLKGLKNGDIFFMISLGKGVYHDTASQESAEIISRLVRIENKLTKIENRLRGDANGRT